MRKFFLQISKGLFAVMMLWIIYLITFATDDYYSCKRIFLISNKRIIVYLFLLVSLVAVLYYVKQKRIHNRTGGLASRLPGFAISDEKYDTVVRYACILLFVVEVYISYNIFFTNEWDPGGIWKTAVARYRDDIGWSLGISHYYSMYPNNLLLLLLETLCLKINSKVGIFTEQYNMMSAIVVDCVTITTACYFTYKTLTLYVKRKSAFSGFVSVTILAGLSPWMTICYSDSLGILFPILGFYLYMKPQKTKIRGIVFQISAVIVCCIGYSIKPQCIIVLIAVILTKIIKNCAKQRWKKMIKPAAMILLRYCA